MQWLCKDSRLDVHIDILRAMLWTVEISSFLR